MIIRPMTEKDELSNLKTKITKLEKIVENQQKLLEYQIDEISELRNSLGNSSSNSSNGSSMITANGHYKDSNNHNNTCLLDTSLHKKY